MENHSITIPVPGLNFDNFAEWALPVISRLELQVLERQCDADLHTWRVEFEGTPLLLRGDHYTECLWLEAQNEEGGDVLAFLAQILADESTFWADKPRWDGYNFTLRLWLRADNAANQQAGYV